MQNKTLKEKLETIIILARECLDELGEETVSVKTISKKTDVGLWLKIVNMIGDCDESVVIQTNVLDKRSSERKILLCFYISHKYFGNEWLTTGDVEKITAELGVKIDRRNASNYLKTLHSYLESGAARKRGQPTPYRLNRKGIKYFEEIIHGKED
jgi:hypothetical protein